MGLKTFIGTSTHMSCYATVRSHLAVPRVRHAMLLCVLLHFHTYVMILITMMILVMKMMTMIMIMIMMNMMKY